MQDEKEYKPFEPKAKEDKVAYKRRKEKWELEKKKQEKDDDIDHRRFNTTLHPKQVMTSFKRGVHKGEYKQEDLITCYRVVLAKLLADPDLSDESFMSMYSVIQNRAQEVYARRSKRLKRIR
ncbi:hypothetical protein [Vibrio phage vB_VhaM_VH-8]|nr:hypothetical protein [Vibrio phage vB_VhaM_VH-8]